MRSPVTVWATKFCSGYNGGAPAPDLQKHPTMALDEALCADYDTDAHLVPYALYRDGEPLDAAPRINTRGLADIEADGMRLLFSAAVIDVDCPAHLKAGSEASPAWIDEHWDLREALPEVLQGFGWYATRGGYRMVWRLPEPLAPQEYLNTIIGLQSELSKHGIEADPLTDWTRCYRLPFVVRDGVAQDLDADLDSIGTLVWKPPKGATFAGIEKAHRPFQLLEGEIIREGARNQTMMQMAGALRRSGFTEENLIATLRLANEKQVDPPLPDSIIVSMARRVCGKEPLSAILPQFPKIEPTEDGEERRSALRMTMTETGVAVRFPSNSETVLARAAGEDLQGREPIVSTQGGLWRCAPSLLWEPVDDEEVVATITGYDGESFVSGSKDGKPKLGKLNIGAAKAYGALRLLKAEAHKPRFFEGAPAGAAFRNQFVRLDDWRIIAEPLAAKHRQRYGLPFDYQPEAQPEAFVGFLRSCWEHEPDRDEMIEALRRWIGAALLGEATHFQKAIVLVGDGANGKSTLQTITKALFPEEAVTSIAPQDMENEYRRAMLAPSRLNIVAEMPEADILTGEAVKALISGDAVTARHIRQSPFQFHPRAAHLFSANTLPAVRDMSPGFWRRWIVFPFNRTFSETEQDRTLAQRVIAEDLPAIASWAVAGVSDLAYRGRFEEPATCVEARDTWRRRVDSVASFIDGKCDPCEYGTQASMLYSQFAEWTQEVGLGKMSLRKFTERLRLLGFAPTRRSGTMHYGLVVQESGAPSYH